MEAREKAREILRRMSAEGSLTAEEVVRRAKSKRSPLHKFFEWEDEVAAHAYRIEQARELIRSFKIRVTVHNVTFRAPEFVKDTTKDAGYTRTITLRTDKDRARDTVIAEFERAASALKRARAVAKAVGMEGEIKDIEKSLGILQTRLQVDWDRAARA